MRTWAQVKDLDQRLKTVHAIILYLYQDPKRSIPNPTSKVDENGHQKRISILESGVFVQSYPNSTSGEFFVPTFQEQLLWERLLTDYPPSEEYKDTFKNLLDEILKVGELTLATNRLNRLS